MTTRGPEPRESRHDRDLIPEGFTEDRLDRGMRAARDAALPGGTGDGGQKDWRANLLTSPGAIERLLRTARRIAVLGIKTEAQEEQPAFYVPAYLAKAGYEIVPVPVYYPEVREILGKPVYRAVADIPGDVDVVLVFRRPNDIPQHVGDILLKRPSAVWMQSGIRNEQVAEWLAREGIGVVQDRCMMVEHRRIAV